MFPEPCSYCGRTAAVSSSHLSLPTSSTAEEIDFIMEQTQRVDEAISALHATRAKFLRRLNELRSPTSNLPPEVLSTVFSHASPPVDFGPSDFVWRKSEKGGEVHRQFILSGVSSYWRQVVSSTPRLWATALISVKLKTLGSKANLLELYLKNVRGVPFSLELHVNRKGASRSDFDPLLRAIQEGGQAFMLLSLSQPPEGWFPMLSSHLPNLEDFRLRWGNLGMTDSAHTSQTSHPISSLRSLQRMFLWQTEIGRLPSDQPCHNITVLHLMDLPPNTCFQLLRSCPNLIEYRYEETYPDQSDPAALDLDHITLHNLRFFQVSNPSFGVVLSFLHFPILQMFSFDLDNDELKTAGFLVFVQHLPTTCSTLEIQGLFTEETIAQVFRVVPPQVQLLKIPFFNRRIISALLSQALWCDSNLGSFNMPGLRQIRMKRIVWDDILRPSGNLGLNSFLDLLSARKALLDGRFVLEIRSSGDVDLTPFKSRLQTMASEGLRLEIYVSGAWLPGLREIYEELDT